MLIALVEDDADQSALYRAWLENVGMAAEVFPSADAFRRQLRTSSFDAVVIDWMLPDGSGVELIEWLRGGQHSKLPIILMTVRNSEADVVRGLQAGADDYLSKPLREHEFIARLRGVMRRAGVSGGDSGISGAEPYSFDLGRRQVTLEGAAVDLTDREFDLATFLFRRQGHVVSRDTLLSQVWNLTSNVNTRTIDTHVSRLRKKLLLDGSRGWRLSSIYQHGYRLERA